MTKVEECTNALTGVGAAIAAGNQAENGICALLVIAAKIAKQQITFILLSPLDTIRKFQEPNSTIPAILNRIATSPIRFLRAVIIPAPLDFSFW